MPADDPMCRQAVTGTPRFGLGRPPELMAVLQILAYPDPRLRKVAGPVSAVTMTALSDFTTTIDLEPPPTESVVEAPEGQ